MKEELKPKRKILIVEDEQDFAALIASVLTKEGYDVSVTNNTEEAMEQAKERIPDLVTLDLQMPRESGLLFYRHMKSCDALKQIPVIVITGITHKDRDMENFVRSFLEVDHLSSPEAYIEKPFHNEKLVNVVEKVLVDN